ncbi:MAG TPA: hypothetical protein DDX75_15880 [Phycisphaerales bacterium]|nr:hypothetical protein [Phycisphaerales bacterium]
MSDRIRNYFFSAKGINGEDVLDSSLTPRMGIFEDYTKGDINSYLILGKLCSCWDT